MKTLTEIYENHKGYNNGDKGTIHSYIEEYEKILCEYKFESKVLEIGIAEGDSLRMWKEYFIDSDIYGMDLVERDVKFDKDKLFFTSSIDENRVNTLLADLKFDVIIDDGSHKMPDQVATYHLFKHRLNSGGVYIIEDIEDIDKDRNAFLSLNSDKNIDIIDLRNVKNRFDDVLIIIKDKI